MKTEKSSALVSGDADLVRAIEHLRRRNDGTDPSCADEQLKSQFKVKSVVSDDDEQTVLTERANELQMTSRNRPKISALEEALLESEKTLTGEPVNEVCDSGDDEPQTDSSENKIRSKLNIKQLDYGYIVTVGCHEFALETHERVIEMLGEYLADPKGTEAKWFANQLKLKRSR